MNVTAPAIPGRAPEEREDHRRQTARLAACAAADVVAAGILLLGTPFPTWIDGLAAGVSHATAVLLLPGLTRARSSRRWLCVAAVLSVPCAGAAVAAATCVTRGHGGAAKKRHRKRRRRPGLARTAIRRLGDTLSPCDALLCGGEEDRRAALSVLSRREDPEAIGLLRRVAAGSDPELALSAALVLDEIGERAERQAVQLETVEARHEAG